MSLKVGLVAVLVSLEARSADDVLKDAAHVAVEVLHVEFAGIGIVDDLMILAGTTWLEHVVAGVHLSCGILTTEPVGHDYALVAPVATQDGLDEVFALGGVGAIDLVVGGHDGPGVGLIDGDLEWLEIDLADGTGGDDSIVARTVGLLVVEGEMLHRGADTVGLYATHVGCRDLTGYEGILGVILEVAAIERIAMDVLGRSEEHVGAILEHFVAHGTTYLLDELLVPGAGQQGADGEVGAVVGLVVTFACGVDAEACGAVGEHSGGNAQASDGVG